MDKELLMERIAALCKEKGVNLTTAFEQSGVGKNFRSNLKTSNPSKKNLYLLAEYFNVTVEYLLGEETDEDLMRKAMGLMLEWLTDNEYDIQEDENNVYTIGKDGSYIYVSNADLAMESLKIKTDADDGFELAMLDWERRNFEKKETLALSEEELYILEKFRSTSRDGKAKIYQAVLNICEDIEKKHTNENTSAVG